MAEVVYDGTVFFVGKYFRRPDRTIDQMVQAARSGKQNIAEASCASGTSKEMEIKLTNVARASLEELLIEEWPKDHPFALRLRALNRTNPTRYETFKKGIEHCDPAISANIIAGLIKVTTYLLDQQIRRLEQEFLLAGGLKERMTAARIASRNSLRSYRSF